MCVSAPQLAYDLLKQLKPKTTSSSDSWNVLMELAATLAEYEVPEILMFCEITGVLQDD